jgi:hypothetical protein
MYGSAISTIVIALWTRVSSPIRSIDACRARALIIVASMPM